MTSVSNIDGIGSPAPPLRPSAEYRTCIFDCDGVILDSNRIKTDAFLLAIEEYGSEPANKFVDYHRAHGGHSRFQKFHYFFSMIAKVEPTHDRMARALEKFSRSIAQGLMECAVDPGLRAVTDSMPNSRFLVVSGGAQEEIRHVFERRGLLDAFSGIYGSPDTKREILEREGKSGGIAKPGIFIGDSRLDYEVATEYGFDFVFVSHWTEFDNWRAFFSERPAIIVDDLGDLVTRLKSTSIA